MSIWTRRLAGLVGASLLAALIIPSTSAGAVVDAGVAGPRLSRVSVVVALGDSVAYGSHCACTPFPPASASLVRATTGVAVRTYNDSYPGFHTQSVLNQLWQSAAVIRHVQNADVVEVLVGANDIGFVPACGTNVACYSGRLMASRDTIQDIVARVRYIARGHSVAIVLMGYWNAWLDGRVAAARGPAYVATSRRLTQAQNSLILGVARSTAAIYVDLWRVFRGVDDHDDTALLADDGDHPNALGHTKIAISVAHALRVLLRA